MHLVKSQNWYYNMEVYAFVYLIIINFSKNVKYLWNGTTHSTSIVNKVAFIFDAGLKNNNNIQNNAKSCYDIKLIGCNIFYFNYSVNHARLRILVTV